MTLSSTEPLEVDSWVTLEQTYTVGSAPIAVGGGIVAGRQWLSDVNDFQNVDPAKDNYLTATTSRAGTRLVPSMMGLTGPHGGHRGAKPTPAFKVEGEPLQPGDTITIVYGDKSGGSRGVKTQFFATDRLLLPIYVDLGDGNLLTPHWPSLQVLGGELAGLRVLAPSVVAVGEPFTLTVRSEDRNLNRARGALPAYEVRLDDRVVANLAAGGEALAVVPDLSLAQPGTYRFTVRDAAGRLTATSNPVWALASPEWRVFWGETHGHTDFAEGQGSPDAFFRYAREDSRLDFATLTEHDFWTDDAEWAAMKELTRRSTEDGRLIAFLGYEWTATPDRGGHHNVFFRTPDRDRVPIQVANRLPMLYDGLRAATSPTTCSSSRTRTRPATGHRATPISSGWRRSTPRMAPSSGTATCSCATASTSASWAAPTTIARCREDRTARTRARCLASQGWPRRWRRRKRRTRCSTLCARGALTPLRASASCSTRDSTELAPASVRPTRRAVRSRPRFRARLRSSASTSFATVRSSSRATTRPPRSDRNGRSRSASSRSRTSSPSIRSTIRAPTASGRARSR